MAEIQGTIQLPSVRIEKNYKGDYTYEVHAYGTEAVNDAKKMFDLVEAYVKTKTDPTPTP